MPDALYRGRAVCSSFASSESESCRVVVISNSRRQDSYNVESDNDAVDRRRSHLVIVRLEVV